jgi:hypothetical protein
MPVDKFGAVIAVQDLERDGKAAEDVLKSRYGPFLGPVFERAELEPASGGIGEDQGEGVFVANEAGVVGDVSISQNPAFLSSHRQNILTGICCLRRVPGFVAPAPLILRRFHSPAQHPFYGGTAGLRLFRLCFRRYSKLDGQDGQVRPDQGTSRVPQTRWKTPK